MPSVSGRFIVDQRLFGPRSFSNGFQDGSQIGVRADQFLTVHREPAPWILDRMHPQPGALPSEITPWFTRHDGDLGRCEHPGPIARPVLIRPANYQLSSEHTRLFDI